MQREHVPLGDTGLRETGGDPAVEPVELSVGEGGAVGPVDQGGSVTELGGAGEDRVVDGEFDGWDVCVLAAEHGSSKSA